MSYPRAANDRHAWLTGPTMGAMREGMGLTRAELAAELDYTPQHLGQWESGAAPIPSSQRQKLVELYTIWRCNVADCHTFDRGISPPRPLPHSGQCPAGWRRSIVWAALYSRDSHYLMTAGPK